MAIPDDTCAACCTCPAPTVLWDTPMADFEPCGYLMSVNHYSSLPESKYFFQDVYSQLVHINGSPCAGYGTIICDYVRTQTITYGAISVTGYAGQASVTCPSQTIVETGTYCEMVTRSTSDAYDGTSHILTITNCVDGGQTTDVLSGEYPYSTFVTAVTGYSMTFSGVFQDERHDRTPGAVLFLSNAWGGEPGIMVGTKRAARYKFSATPTPSKVGLGKYHLAWVERTMPLLAADGVALTDLVVVNRGCYRPVVTVGSGSIPADRRLVPMPVMASDGTIAGISILAPGNYRPTLTFSAPPSGGVRATGEVLTMNPSTGAVATWQINNPGSGYTSAPTVTFTTSPRTTATATASLSGGRVSGLTLTNAGDYRPTLSISGSSGWVPSLAADGRVSGIAGGSGASYLPTASIIVPGYGSGAVVALTMDSTGGISTATLTSAGSGYTALATGEQPRCSLSTPYFVTLDARIDVICGTETAFSLDVAAGASLVEFPSGSYYEISSPSAGYLTTVARVVATCT